MNTVLAINVFTGRKGICWNTRMVIVTKSINELMQITMNIYIVSKASQYGHTVIGL